MKNVRPTILRLLSAHGQRPGDPALPQAVLPARRRPVRRGEGRGRRSSGTRWTRWCRRWPSSSRWASRPSSSTAPAPSSTTRWPPRASRRRSWTACATPRRRGWPWCAGSRSARTSAWWRPFRRWASAPRPSTPASSSPSSLDPDSTASWAGWCASTSAGIEAAIGADSIPVIASLGETAGGQILNVNADWAANELIKKMEPYKIIFLTGTGGILDERGKLIESISLSTQYEHLMAPALAPLGDAREARADPRPPHGPAAVQLALHHHARRDGQGAVHPPGLRHAGATRRGHPRLRLVGRAWTWSACAPLIESSFGRRSPPTTSRPPRPYRIYLSEHYRAAIVLPARASSPTWTSSL